MWPRNPLKLFTICLLSLTIAMQGSAGTAAQPDAKRCAAPIPASDAEFKPGQVWKLKGREWEPDLTATVLRVESFQKVGIFVHIRIDNAVMRTCPGYPDWHSLEHAPIAKAALEQSILELIRSDAPVPDYREGYGRWLSDCGWVFSIIVAEILNLNEKTARVNFGCS